MSTDNLVAYYRQRAAEYENIYHKPERQADLAAATAMLQDIFKGKEVYEMACGTGYWTERIAMTAASITATDINQAVLDIAQQKDYPNRNVHYQTADIFQTVPDRQYDALFGGFIWSHILMKDLDRFIVIARSWVKPGGLIVFMDNNYVEGSNHAITRTDPEGNTFQSRKLKDGSTHEVLKNFPDEQFLKEKLGQKSTYHHNRFFWITSTAV